MLYIFNQDEELQTILKPDGPCPYREATHIEQVNKDHTFSFWVPADQSDSQHVKEENLVAFKDGDGDIRLFVIKELDEIHEDVLYKGAFCVAAWMDELGDEPLTDIRPQDKTAAQALTSALTNTRWQVGNVASLGLNSTNFYYESVKSAIEKILNTWGGEIKDRITVVNGVITGRYIDILARRGADTGKRFEITKDIQSLKRTVLSYPKTALYGRGKGEQSGDGYGRRITFADVEWSVANGDPVDKPAGQEWVGDATALATYGRKNTNGTRRHRYGFFDSSEEEKPEQLLADTWKELRSKKHPLVSYSLKVIDLEKVTGFEHEKVRLGDTVFCIDRLFATPVLIEGRVIEIKRYRHESERTEVVIGNFIPLFTNSKRLDKIEAKLNDKSGIWDSGGTEPVTDEDFEDVVPNVPSNVTAKGLFKMIMLEWTFENKAYIANYEVYASQVEDFTPDTSNLVWRGKTGGMSFKAETDQQWYFRVRAVNTHGTPSAFSDQLVATTARVAGQDIVPLTITNELIAEEANIDGAKIAEATITDAHITNLTWDKGEGGQITLGGTSNGYGRMIVLDANGESIADLNAERGGFDRLYVGYLTSPSIINVNREAYSLFVDTLNGLDTNDGLSWASAKKTIQSCIDSIPKYNMKDVTIYCHYDNARKVYGDIDISGFIGPGRIIIDGQNLSNCILGSIITYGSTNAIGIKNVTVNPQGDGVWVGRSGEVFCDNVVVNGRGGGAGFASSFGGVLNLKDCQVYNVGIGNFAYGGDIFVRNCRGLANDYGSAAQSGGTVKLYGDNQPAGNIAGHYVDSAGQIIGSANYDYGIATPAVPAEQTKFIDSVGGNNYSESGGFWSNDGVKQGNYGYGNRKGCWFFGTSILDQIGAGKTIKSMKIFVQRTSNGGSSSYQRLSLRAHGYASQPGGSPDLSGEIGSINLAWGESGWITVDSSVYAAFASGTYRGFGLYTGGDNYLICGTWAQVAVTYQ